MKVLAIDPGYDRLGVAVVEKQSGEEVLLYSGCVETNKKTNLDERLCEIGDQFSKLLKKHRPDLVAIETLFFNKNVTTAIGVAQARGIIMYLAKSGGVNVREYGPQEIKVAITGYGKSDKSAVISMVKRLVKNVPENALDDEYDAIAIGVTCLVSTPKLPLKRL